MDDEVEGMNAHQQMLNEGFTFATGLSGSESWDEYVNRLDSYQYGPKGQWVPSTFLVAEVDAKIVGRTSIRYELDALLAHDGGHIGYGVVPSERKKVTPLKFSFRAWTLRGARAFNVFL